jgi:hypothetical protein
MQRPKFGLFGLYDVTRRTMRRNNDGYGWCTRDERIAAEAAAPRGLVVVPVQAWQDHRAAIRECTTTDAVRELVAARTGWRLS